MEIKAQLNYLRIAPRKVRSVVDLMRGKEIKEAEHQLKFLPRIGSMAILKLLKSAISNAKNNFNLEKENLYIKNIRVNEGVPYRRQMPMSRGRAYPIMKRTSCVILILDVKEGVKIPATTRQDVSTFGGKQAGPPKSESFGGETKKEIKEEVNKPFKSRNKKLVKATTQKAKSPNWVKKMFRRKSM